jgi:K+-sensing histidine kinase KdpD
MLSDPGTFRELALPVASLAAFFITAVTVPFPQQIVGRSIFAILFVVVAAAGRVGGRAAAVSCAAMAAFSFDFFHIEPLRVLHARTLLLLLVVFGAMAALSGRRRID